MKTAEEYLMVQFEPDSQLFQIKREDLRIAIILNPSLELIESAINEARKEAIEECAKVATSVPYKIQNLEYHLNNLVDNMLLVNLLKWKTNF